MVLKRRNFLITFTVLGLAMCICTGLQLLGAAFYAMTSQIALSLEGSGFSLLSGLFVSPWTETLVQYVFCVGLPSLALVPMTWFVKTDRRPSFSLPFSVWISAFFMALGVGYLLNYAGLFCNELIAAFTGASPDQMNPVVSAMEELTPSMALYSCVVAPVTEELIFRGLLLGKARRFGDRTAVCFSAVMFGLMHGNLNQFLYATAIGLILGYIAVRTNQLRYNILLHMAVNGFSVLLVVLEMLLSSTGMWVLQDAFDKLCLILIACFIIAGIYFLIRDGRRYWWQMGKENGPATSYRKYVYLNPGFFLYMLIALVEMLSYMV